MTGTGKQLHFGCFSRSIFLLVAQLSGFLALRPEVKIAFHWNLFFKNQAFGSQAKPFADREKRH